MLGRLNADPLDVDAAEAPLGEGGFCCTLQYGPFPISPGDRRKEMRERRQRIGLHPRPLDAVHDFGDGAGGGTVAPTSTCATAAE